MIDWLGQAWMCPVCGEVRRRPRIDHETAERWHSWKCQEPMALVNIEAVGG